MAPGIGPAFPCGSMCNRSVTSAFWSPGCVEVAADEVVFSFLPHCRNSRASSSGIASAGLHDSIVETTSRHTESQPAHQFTNRKQTEIAGMDIELLFHQAYWSSLPCPKRPSRRLSISSLSRQRLHVWDLRCQSVPHRQTYLLQKQDPLSQFPSLDRTHMGATLFQT